MTLPKFFTVDQVAEITHAPRSSVFHWIYTQKLRSTRVGKRRLVSEADLTAFMGIAMARQVVTQIAEDVKGAFHPPGKKGRSTKKQDSARRGR